MKKKKTTTQKSLTEGKVCYSVDWTLINLCMAHSVHIAVIAKQKP